MSEQEKQLIELITQTLKIINKELTAISNNLAEITKLVKAEMDGN